MMNEPESGKATMGAARKNELKNLIDKLPDEHVEVAHSLLVNIVSDPDFNERLLFLTADDWAVLNATGPTDALKEAIASLANLSAKRK